MSYLNTYELYQCLVRGEPMDSVALLEQVDQRKLARAILKSKGGAFQPFISSGEPLIDKSRAKMSFWDERQLRRVYEKLRISKDESERGLQQLLKLKEKYPDVPAIYNYIVLAYAMMGLEEERYQSVVETVQRFPDYLFGKISAADYYLRNVHEIT